MIIDRSRFKFIDGLRGIAILLVVVYHLYYLQFPRSESGNFILDAGNLTRFGKMGIHIFFVISGFIVSFITFNKVTSWSFIGKFILRRQVRLDPAFWLAVVLGIVVAWGSVLYLSNKGYLPTALDIITNLTYIFDITGHYDIIRVGWTLCIEIQFYIAFILITYLMYSMRFAKMWIDLLYYMLFVISVFCLCNFGHAGDAYITNHWFIFFMGIAVTLNTKGKMSDTFYALILLTPFVFLILYPSLNPAILVFAATTSLSLFIAFKLKKENSWLSSRFYQFFGMISYSLYLTHCLIGNRIVRYLIERMNWQPGKSVLAFLILTIAFILSCLVAISFYYFIEKRSIQWSKKLTA